MVLATPAIFEAGWRPSWVLNGLGLTMELRAAAVKRREFVSGWNYSVKARGPKPVRWLVPAGSVFFFEVTSGDAAGLADAWLSPVSDHLFDRRDGYGLALWGTWQTSGGDIR
jgi:CRISPR-associated protein Cmr3